MGHRLMGQVWGIREGDSRYQIVIENFRFQRVNRPGRA